MGAMQTKEVDQDHEYPQNDPFIPPKGNVCYINNIPPELLSHIFELGAADDESEEEDDVKDTHGSDAGTTEESENEDGDDEDEDEDEDEDAGEDGDSDATGSSDYPPPWPPFQILVSHVCRHWRNVALSTPSLWTTIPVGPGDRPPYEHVSTLLERSKSLPIDIFVDCEPHEDDDCIPSDDDLKFLYSLLIPYIHRWRTIEVTILEYHHMYVFLNAVSDPSISAAPQLTTLALYDHYETEEFESFGHPSMSKHLTIFGGSAPCLSNVVLWGVHVDWNQPWIASASKLVDLELAYHAEDVRPSWAQFSTILRGASALERLSLRQSGPSGDPAGWVVEPTPGNPGDSNTPIQLLKVSDFVFAFQTPEHAIGLVRRFYLPALKHLVLDFDNGDFTDFVHELAGPATSPSPPSAQEKSRSLLSGLESLEIAGLPCRTECVETLYGELQNLTALNISLSYLHVSFIDILCKPCTLIGRGDIWLPRLAALHVSGTSGDTLRRVVKKRKDAGVPLESLYAERSCDLDTEDEKWLKENLKTFEIFEGSDDEDVIDLDDFQGEDADAWSDMDF